MSKLDSSAVERMIQQVTEAMRLVESVNDSFVFSGMKEFDLEGPAPDGVHPEAWKTLRERFQLLKSEVSSLVHHYGAKVVIDRGRRA